MKKIWLFIGIIFLFFLPWSFFLDTFSAQKIAGEQFLEPNEDNTATIEVDQKLCKILSQPFVYLAKGRQSFVFESLDKKYVLKFFNTQRFDLPLFLKKMPLPTSLSNYREKKIRKKRAKLDAFYYHSYKLAYEKWKKPSALVYVHFSKGPKLPTVSLRAFHRHIMIDLTSTPFVLQKKAEGSFYPHVKKKILEGKAKELFKELLLLLRSRIDKNIADDDLDMGANFGVKGGKLIVLDVGRIYETDSLCERENQYKELKRTTYLFRKWLSKNYPENISYWDQLVEGSCRK